MKNICLTKICILAPLAVSSAPMSASGADQPNIIIIQADDLGWDDLGLHGNKLIETPHLDALGKASVQFSQFYVNPVSAPSRASLLTGRHFLRTGVSHVHGGKDYLNLNETTLAQRLLELGYATGMWGKWHSGSAEGYYPWQRGFQQAYMAQLYQHARAEGALNGQHVAPGTRADLAATDFALRFIENNRARPFFAYIAYIAPHAPLNAPDSLIARYTAKGLSSQLATLYGMVDFMDSQVGRVMAKLRELNLEENTIVFFLSDNGPAANTGQLSDQDRAIRYINRLRGHKGNIWENGVKSPLFVYGKSRFKPHTTNQLADITDIFPTIVALAGGQPENNPLPLDGKDLSPVLNGQKLLPETKISFNYAHKGWQPTDAPYNPDGTFDEYAPVTPEIKLTLCVDSQAVSVRKGDYKLILNPGPSAGAPKKCGNMVLFNIAKDPCETKNLCTKKPEIASELHTGLSNWWSEIISDQGSFNTPVLKISNTGQTTIKATATCRISKGLKNTVEALKYWDSSGQWAEYQIETTHAGQFTIILEGLESWDDKVAFELDADGQISAGTSNQSARISLSTSRLPQGLQTIRIRMIQAGKSPQALKAIHFIPEN